MLDGSGLSLWSRGREPAAGHGAGADAARTCLASGMRMIAGAVGDALFPRRCAVCRCFWLDLAPEAREIGVEGMERATADRMSAVFREGSGRFLCPACRGTFEPTASPLCDACGVMFVSRAGEDHRCGECLEKPPVFRRARAAGVYSGPLMALIHQLKYRSRLALAAPLALLLREAFARHWRPGEVEVVLPVPLHDGRLRRRGFNQAQLLVTRWAAAERKAGAHRLEFPLGRRLFRRSRATAPQTGLGKPERRRNLRGAFSVTDPAAVAGRRILLVDDVYTTGATVDEAARVLKRNGAEAVDVLTLARTMPRAGRR